MLFKKWSINVAQKVIHKRYPRSGSQTLLKSDPKLLLKNWPSKFTQKVIHNFYSKTGPQTLFKKWSTKVTQNNGLQTLLIFLTLDNMTAHLILNKDSAQKCFLTDFMLLIFFNPWKHDSTLKIEKVSTRKIKKDFTRMIHKDSTQKCFFNPFHATNLF